MFAERGGRVSNPNPKLLKELFKEPFFSLSLDIFRERAGEVKSKPYEEPFQLKFGYFSRKGGGGPDQIPNF